MVVPLAVVRRDRAAAEYDRAVQCAFLLESDRQSLMDVYRVCCGNRDEPRHEKIRQALQERRKKQEKEF